MKVLFLQALHEMHKILSQVEILGSPIMLGSSLISGLSTFLAEPAKARNPTEFARGVGTGSVTLVKMASFGILTFIGQVRPHPPSTPPDHPFALISTSPTLKCSVLTPAQPSTCLSDRGQTMQHAVSTLGSFQTTESPVVVLSLSV